MTGFHGPAESVLVQDSDVALSEAEVNALTAKMASFDKLISERLVAKYKIEVQFGKNRSTWKPFSGAVSIYLSGSKFNGGGDEKLYMCPKPGCKGILYPRDRYSVLEQDRVQERILCETCNLRWKPEELIGERLCCLVPRNWALVIMEFFIRLDHNADIYIKYHPTDIRTKTALELERKRWGEELAKARFTRALHIYPLKNIIKDTSSGANLYDRFVDFVTA